MRSKNWTLGKGKYYFRIKSGQQQIMIHRSKKDKALQVYQNYEKLGKQVEWLGKWDGKKFVEEELAASA